MAKHAPIPADRPHAPGLFDWIGDNILGGIWRSLQTLVFGMIPTWLLVLAALLAAAWVWKRFGWQGLIALGLFLLTFGAYRQGWRDRGDGKPALFPTEAQWPDAPPEPRPGNGILEAILPKRRSTFNAPRRYNPDTNSWE